MKDLIDREDLMRKYTTSFLHNNRHNTVDELQVLLKLIDDAPTVDAFEVVRCINCMYFNRDVFADFAGIPIIVAHNLCAFNKDNPIKVNDDHFCSWGKAKDGDSGEQGNSNKGS